MELAFLPRIYSSCLFGCRLFFRKEKGKKRQRRRTGSAGKETQSDEEARRIKAAQHFSAYWRKGRKKKRTLEVCRNVRALVVYSRSAGLEATQSPVEIGRVRTAVALSLSLSCRSLFFFFFFVADAD